MTKPGFFRNLLEDPRHHSRGFLCVSFPFLSELAVQQCLLVVDPEQKDAQNQKPGGQPDP